MKTIDHFHAEDVHVAERYILGELSATEAEEFEQHYFECQQCAIAVESASLFAANARAVFAEPAAVAAASRVEKPRPAVKSAWFPQFWFPQLKSRPLFAFPMAAACALALLVIYQNAVTIPGMRQAADTARALPAFQLIGASRGDGAQVKLPAGASSFALAADIPPDARFATYICTLAENGRTVFEVHAPAPAEGQPITILVPAKSLQPGPHELSIFGASQNGAPASKVSGYTFNLELNN
jgi:anti-sigma factor RsiW